MVMRRASKIPSPYLEIADINYKKYLSKGLSDENLEKYFAGTFDSIVEERGLYACWTCPACLAKGNVSFGWGTKPDTCPKCGKKTYAVATFQAWAPATGEMFEWAFCHLIQTHFGIYLIPSSEYLYDFSFPPKTVIEAKGSPSYITNPDGTKYPLDRPGLERSDSEKKAFANAKAFKKDNPEFNFVIVTNACPNKIRGYTNRDVTRVVDLSRKEELDTLVKELERWKS